jgi:hypothetical protein
MAESLPTSERLGLLIEIIKRIFVFDAYEHFTWYDQVTFDSPADLRTFLHRPVKPPLSDLAN